MEDSNGITFTLDEIGSEFSEVSETTLDLKVEDLAGEGDKGDESQPAVESIEAPKPAKEVETVATTETDLVIEKTPSSLVKLAKDLLGVDTFIRVNDKGEDEEVTLEDANLTADDIVELVNNKKSLELDDIKSSSVSIKNLDDNQKAIIDIVAKGGNIQALLELQKTYVDPISKLDLDKEKDQEEAVYLHSKASGMTDEAIEYAIEGMKTKGVLKDKAEIAINDLNEAVKNQTLEQQKIANEAIEARKEKLKEYKKELKKNVKEQFKDLNDTAVNKINDFASKPKEDGKYEMDEVYMAMRGNPELAPKLALFLYDIEQYNKVITKEAPFKEAVKTESKLRLGRLTSSSSGAKTKFEDNRELKIDF